MQKLEKSLIPNREENLSSSRKVLLAFTIVAFLLTACNLGPTISNTFDITPTPPPTVPPTATYCWDCPAYEEMPPGLQQTIEAGGP